MPTFTKNLGLTKPDENDFYNQQTEQCDNWDKIDTWSEGIDNKTKGATSAVAGIVKYGTDTSTALEGSKLAEILGIEYGGVLNNTNTKVAGKGYYDTANKKIYKCTTNTSINYADAGYFIEVSNNDLLGKLQNLFLIKQLNTNTAVYEGDSIKLSESFKNYKYITFEYGDSRGSDYMSKTILSESVVITGHLHLNSYDTNDGTLNEVGDEILVIRTESETSFKIISKYNNRIKLAPNQGYVILFRISGSN